jgi:hypothetical protein
MHFAEMPKCWIAQLVRINDRYGEVCGKASALFTDLRLQSLHSFLYTYRGNTAYGTFAELT